MLAKLAAFIQVASAAGLCSLPCSSDTEMKSDTADNAIDVAVCIEFLKHFNASLTVVELLVIISFYFWHMIDIEKCFLQLRVKNYDVSGGIDGTALHVS